MRLRCESPTTHTNIFSVQLKHFQQKCHHRNAQPAIWSNRRNSFCVVALSLHIFAIFVVDLNTFWVGVCVWVPNTIDLHCPSCVETDERKSVRLMGLAGCCPVYIKILSIWVRVQAMHIRARVWRYVTNRCTMSRWMISHFATFAADAMRESSWCHYCPFMHRNVTTYIITHSESRW